MYEPQKDACVELCFACWLSAIRAFLSFFKLRGMTMLERWHVVPELTHAINLESALLFFSLRGVPTCEYGRS